MTIVLGAALVRGFALVERVAGGEEPLPPVDQDPEAVQEAACRIVERNPTVCAPPTTPAPPSGSGGGGPNLDFLGLLLWAVLIAAVAWLIWVVIREFSGRSGRRAKAEGDTDSDDDLDVVEAVGVAVDRSREPLNWRAEAEAHRAAGRYRDALRCRYRALVGDLARGGWIDEIPGRTTGEERAQMRVVRPEASPPFEAAAELFDGAWYGHLPTSAADDDRFQRYEQQVLATAGARR